MSASLVDPRNILVSIDPARRTIPPASIEGKSYAIFAGVALLDAPPAPATASSHVFLAMTVHTGLGTSTYGLAKSLRLGMGGSRHVHDTFQTCGSAFGLCSNKMVVLL